MLEKYGLKPNDAILAEEKHMGIYEDLLNNRDAKLLAGGAAQNTARGAQVRSEKRKILVAPSESSEEQSMPLPLRSDGASLPYQSPSNVLWTAVHASRRLGSLHRLRRQ